MSEELTNFGKATEGILGLIAITLKARMLVLDIAPGSIFLSFPRKGEPRRLPIRKLKSPFRGFAPKRQLIPQPAHVWRQRSRCLPMY